MLISGLQKLTLLDFPGHTACTVFTGGCNLRCPFCHNAVLVTDAASVETIPEEEFFAFLKKRQGVLSGVAITGGEPLLQPDIRSFIEKVRALGYKIKLDTNGFFPERFIPLAEAGLVDYAAVDIKNCKRRYAETCGREALDLAPIEETVRYLMEDHVDYEFRTTIVRAFHGKEEIEEIGTWIRGAKRWFLQNFTDSGDLVGGIPEEGLREVPKQELLSMLEEARKFVTAAAVRGV